VAAEVEPVDDVVEVALGLRLPGEELLPLPLLEQLPGEHVAVGVALGVEPGAGVAVPVPGPADAAACLEQRDGEAGLPRPVELVDAGDARTDDEDIHVGGIGSGRTGTPGACGLGGCRHAAGAWASGARSACRHAAAADSNLVPTG
jgi:hypothetical protein